MSDFKIQAGTGALSGYRVLDLSRILAGPWACQMLGDLGAEVIKVERPGEGDGSRVYGPPFLHDAHGHAMNASSMYLSANRNKKGVAIDIATAGGQDLVRQLAAQCDVLVENYKVDDLKRYGLDYDAIRAINPNIVYCSITGFGQTGPSRHRLGYDPIFQAMSGLMAVTGHPDGVPGAGPMKAGPSISDVVGGLFADVAILAALLRRERGGGGEYIDLSLLDTSIALTSHLAQFYLMSGELPKRRGTGGNGGVPAQAYPCQGGSVLISASTDQQYERMCHVLGRPDLALDSRYRLQRDRNGHREELTAKVAQAVAQFSMAPLLEALEAAAVPAAPIYTTAEVFEDPQVKARDMSVEISHPDAGALRVVGNPIKLREGSIAPFTAPPRLGQHTREVLAGLLHLDAAAIEQLRESRVVAMDEQRTEATGAEPPP